MVQKWMREDQIGPLGLEIGSFEGEILLRVSPLLFLNEQHFRTRDEAW